MDDYGRFYGTALHNNSQLPSGSTNQYIASGTYTPTFVGINNISSISGSTFMWVRVGNVVIAFGKIAVNYVGSFSSNGDATFRMSIPIATAISTQTDLCGTVTVETASAGAASDANWLVEGYTGATGQVFVSARPNDAVATRYYRISFMYTVA
jgi:hypothetical protein